MTKTTNYQLNQWAKSDRVMMDDFNADNTKIDAALKANADTAAANTQTLAAQAQAIAKLGNGAVAFGTYTGNGKSGSSYPNTLNFPHKPVLVFVQATERDPIFRMMLVRGSKWASASPTDPSNYSKIVVNWTETSVTWYSEANDSGQLNRNISYNYAALLSVE